MKRFMDKDFLLDTETAKHLFLRRKSQKITISAALPKSGSAVTIINGALSVQTGRQKKKLPVRNRQTWKNS